MFFVYLTLLSSTRFIETKYLSSLDMEISKIGIMELSNNILVINYEKPNIETIIYYEDKLTLKNDKNEITTYTYEEHPKIEYFGLLLKSIINNTYENLENMFKIKKEKNKRILTAKSSVSGTIDYLEVFYKDGKLSSINFHMINSDKITIETTN